MELVDVEDRDIEEGGAVVVVCEGRVGFRVAPGKVVVWIVGRPVDELVVFMLV